MAQASKNTAGAVLAHYKGYQDTQNKGERNGKLNLDMNMDIDNTNYFFIS